MTSRETIEALRNSDIWTCLSSEEKIDAICYALAAVGSKIHARNDAIDMADLIGETYRG